jgi:hypothetical protein
MKVKELIDQLKNQDPEKEVMIQQGYDWDYMTVHTVREEEILDMDGVNDEIIKAVVIEYT